jgi:uncharacterized protein DUF6152
MSKTFLAGFGFVIGVLLISLPAAAHHSFAPFDTDREIEVTGTVTEFE